MSGTRAISTSRRELSSSFFSLQGKAPKESHAILTETLACFLPGRAKDLSGPQYFITTVSACLDPSVHVSSVSNFEPNENCTLLGYYAASNDNFLPTFRENLPVPSSGFKSVEA